MKVKSLCSAVINCDINWSLGIELLRYFGEAMSTKNSLVVYRIHTHVCAHLQNTGQTWKDHQSNFGKCSRRNWRCLKLLLDIYKSECQWRLLLRVSNHCLLLILSSCPSKIERQRPNIKAVRRVFMRKRCPSLGVCLSSNLLTDILSVPPNEIIKSFFVLIHINIFM